MSERNESTRVCKCCGIERSINEYDLNNNGRPIGVCRKCRRAQQTVSNLRSRDVLSEAQHERLLESTRWLELCQQNTGYTPRSRAKRDKIDFADPTELEKLQQGIAKKASNDTKEESKCQATY